MFTFILNWFRKRRSPWASIAVPEKKASMNFVMPQHVHIHWHVSDMNKIPQNVIWNAGQLVVSDSTPIEIKSHQYDEYLLDRARTQWQFGDWESLVKLNCDMIEKHPERAKIALLVAAGHSQMGNMNEARDFVQLARDWGCDKQLISRVLVAGVYNTLGKAAAIGGQQDKALGLFEESVRVGMPGGEGRLLINARTNEQLAQLGFPEGMKINPNETAQIVNNFGLSHISTKVEKNYVSLLRKEKNRLQKIIENTQLISGLKQPLEHKIFSIGSNKTGTTSLDSAMQTLGFTTMPEDLAYQYLTLEGDEKIQEKKFKCLIEAEAGKFNFFEDLPFCYGENYKVIDEYYPDAKFILSVRTSDDWFSSCTRWIEKLGIDADAIYEWIWGIRFVIENKKEIVDLYNKRNADIQDYFSGRSNKLLVVQIEQATFTNLCEFLCIEAGMTVNLDFPKENINELKNH